VFGKVLDFKKLLFDIIKRKKKLEEKGKLSSWMISK